MALRRRTITPRCAIRCAPCESVMLIMAGRSSGVSPTARAREKSNESMSGRLRAILAASTATTITSMIWVSSTLRRPTPRSKSVSGGRRLRRRAVWPSTVAEPVLTTSSVPVPLATLEPIINTLVRSARLAAGATVPGVLSTAKLSPVSAAWFTESASASRSRPSAGIRLPAETSTTSPGTISSAGTSVRWPSRRTVQR